MPYKPYQYSEKLKPQTPDEVERLLLSMEGNIDPKRRAMFTELFPFDTQELWLRGIVIESIQRAEQFDDISTIRSQFSDAEYYYDSYLSLLESHKKDISSDLKTARSLVSLKSQVAHEIDDVHGVKRVIDLINQLRKADIGNVDFFVKLMSATYTMQHVYGMEDFTIVHEVVDNKISDLIKKDLYGNILSGLLHIKSDSTYYLPDFFDEYIDVTEKRFAKHLVSLTEDYYQFKKAKNEFTMMKAEYEKRSVELPFSIIQAFARAENINSEQITADRGENWAVA